MTFGFPRQRWQAHHCFSWELHYAQSHCGQLSNISGDVAAGHSLLRTTVPQLKIWLLVPRNMALSMLLGLSMTLLQNVIIPSLMYYVGCAEWTAPYAQSHRDIRRCDSILFNRLSGLGYIHSPRRQDTLQVFALLLLPFEVFMASAVLFCMIGCAFYFT